MRSPFPGMDPYLEQRWSDVHGTLITAIKDAIQPLLPPELRARSEEKVWLEAEESSAVRRRYKADVALVERPSRALDIEPVVGAGVATVDPVIVEIDDSPHVDRHVHIIDVSSGNRVVTAIKVLSPGNKSAGLLNRRYRRKIRDYIRAGVNVVEIDLLFGSRRRLPVSRDDLPSSKRTPYLVCVNREVCPEQWEVYPVELRSRLPRVPVPLREGDRDIPLDLQPLIDRAYESGRHDDIDYTRPTVAPLPPSDAAWADALLRGAGVRE